MSTPSEVEVSYDVGNDFFSLWLDEGMNYSCGIWEGARSLEHAQLLKLAWHHDAARVAPDKRVLDIGCGWGANLAYLTMKRAVRSAHGITLSPAQYEAVKQRKLPGVTVELISYRDFVPEQAFDAVISIGMFEHVARPEELAEGEHILRYREYFDLVWRWTKPGAHFGLQLVQTLKLPRRGSELKELAWATRSMFPGAIAPRTEDVLLAAYPRWEVMTVVTRREDYARTTHAWLERLRTNEDRIRARWGSLYEQYERYLNVCVQSFSEGFLTLGQYSLRRRS